MNATKLRSDKNKQRSLSKMFTLNLQIKKGNVWNISLCYLVHLLFLGCDMDISCVFVIPRLWHGYFMCVCYS